jgi:hypothetical protein
MLLPPKGQITPATYRLLRRLHQPQTVRQSLNMSVHFLELKNPYL